MNGFLRYGFAGRRHFLPNLLILLILVFCAHFLFSQSFHSHGGVIPNNSTGNCFSQTVSGVGTLSAGSGIVRVCLSIDAPRPNDMDISLRSPDGTVVSLSTDNGGSSGNDYYAGLCFSDCGPSGPITSGSNFRGVYRPEGTLSTFNSGVSGDGNWELCIDDDNASGTDGLLNYWSLHFGTPTAPTIPTGETCADAYVLTSLPWEHTCMTLAGSLDNYSACTGMMEGADYLFAYTPSALGEYLSVDIAQDFSAPSGFPTVLLLDTCPDVAMNQNCIQHEIQFSSSENILHITSQPLTQGKTYFIVVSSTSGTGGNYDIRIASGENGNEDCLNATEINQNKEYAGNNKGATLSNPQAPSTAEMTCNGSIDNFIFYTFTTDAGGSTVYINVTDIDCDLSCGGACGIQLALFQEPVGGACLGPGTWGAPVYCEASTQTNVYYAWSGLLPATRYYLMVDGNAGSQCVWNLRAMGDFTQLLPVEFSSIEVTAEDHVNEVTWTTADEINVSHFEVEHALSPNDFTTVGIVQPTGGIRKEQSYTFDHSTDLPGVHYYRVKNVDQDGREGYSEIKTVWVKETEQFLRVYPNPAQDRLNLRFSAQGNTRISIKGMDGKEWHFFSEEVNEEIYNQSFDVSHLNAGLYVVQVVSGEGVPLVRKFTKY